MRQPQLRDAAERGHDREPLPGLIQHSFALRMDSARRPFLRGDGIERIAERFALPGDGEVEGFVVGPVRRPAKVRELARAAFHSPLAQLDLTGMRPVKQHVLDGEPLPAALSWANSPAAGDETFAEEPRFIFGRAEDEGGRIGVNDFIVRTRGGGREVAGDVSAALLEVLAQRRSRLFGLSLAARIVNVMLPHAKLSPTKGDCGSWLLHPLVTFVCDGRDHDDFSNTYSLTLFLVPVEGKALDRRHISLREITQMVNAGWCLATSPPDWEIPRFDATGSLLPYLSKLSRCKAPAQRELTLRQLTEAAAFGLALSVAQGSSGRAEPQTKRRIGDDVLAALGSARVSSVLVVDPSLSREDVHKPIEKFGPPGVLLPLMETLSRENRSPWRPWSARERRRYRLDRPFVDDDSYVAGLLPRNRCLVVASVGAGQHRVRESGLMQAGSAAYMVIGAASAIGTMRAIDRELEWMEGEDPRKIADIDGEIAADLHDLYDLDVTREAFRHIYRLMRARLGIVRDFETLQSKMEALYRVTSTKESVRSQRLLMWLTLAIVVLSVLLLVKPGG